MRMLNTTPATVIPPHTAATVVTKSGTATMVFVAGQVSRLSFLRAQSAPDDLKVLIEWDMGVELHGLEEEGPGVLDETEEQIEEYRNAHEEGQYVHLVL